MDSLDFAFRGSLASGFRGICWYILRNQLQHYKRPDGNNSRRFPARTTFQGYEKVGTYIIQYENGDLVVSGHDLL